MHARAPPMCGTARMQVFVCERARTCLACARARASLVCVHEGVVWTGGGGRRRGCGGREGGCCCLLLALFFTDCRSRRLRLGTGRLQPHKQQYSYRYCHYSHRYCHYSYSYSALSRCWHRHLNRERARRASRGVAVIAPKECEESLRRAGCAISGAERRWDSVEGTDGYCQ